VVNNKMKLMNGDCLSRMDDIPDGSIDLILVDLPYGVTNNRWDCPLDPETLWKHFERLTSDSGSVVLTATQPFASRLIVDNISFCKKLKFKYDLIWEKTISSGQLNVKRQPLRSHESILIFSKPKPAYNEQKTEGEPYKINRKLKQYESSYGKQKDNVNKVNDGYRHARSVIKMSNPRIKNGHPTEKPVTLMKYLVETYSNPGDSILDCCMGHGSTGIAALNLNRHFIGIEMDEEYFEKAKEKLTFLLTPTLSVLL
jgi:site-specific DNA-methyltransferase (adenine-specific)